jgi:hypothetical protein
MKQRNFGILIAVVAASSLAARGSADQTPKTLRKLSDGTVVVAGSAGSDAYFSQRFDTTGKRLKTLSLLSLHLPVAAQYLAIAGDGGTVVLSSTATGGLWVNKYGPSGRQAWLSAATYRGAGGGADVPVSVVIDTAGDVVVLARTRTAADRANYATWKIDGTTGTTRWGPRFYDGSSSGDSIPVAMTLDPADNVIVTGYLFNGTDEDGVTLMYDGATGDRIGATMVLAVPGHNDRSLAIVAGSDSLTVASTTSGDGQVALVTARYDRTTGAPIWSTRTFAPIGDHLVPTAAVLDAAGNLFVTGWDMDFATGFAYETMKFDGVSGSLVWGPVRTGTNGFPVAITVVAGNPIVTGYTTNAAGNSDISTYGFDGGTGARQWVSTFNGAANGDDVPVALAADGLGEFWMTGRSDTRSGIQAVTMRRDALTGL